jgi:FkbM family methyltransferase
LDTIRKSLSALLEAASRPLSERDLPEIVIYGAGNCGRKLAKTAIDKGMRVLAFLDAQAISMRTVDGIPCHLPRSEEACALAAKGTPAIIGVFNYAADPTPILTLLKEAGFVSIISYFEIHERLGMAPDFWLGPRLALNERQEEILNGLEFFEDQVSRQVYHDHLALRLTFDQGLLASPAIETQYSPTDLPPLRQPMRLVDGGAYIGDTIDFFLDQGVRMEAVAAFEPDMINFRKLVDASSRYTAEGIETLLYPCGIGGETGMLRFQSGQGAGSQLTKSGDLHVQVMALDDVLPNFKPTLVKLDIEGAEIDALHGARRTIQQDMPDLAVCVYHTSAHLWEIPKLIRELFPTYRLSLRAHRFNGFDIELYATKA